MGGRRIHDFQLAGVPCLIKIYEEKKARAAQLSEVDEFLILSRWRCHGIAINLSSGGIRTSELVGCGGNVSQATFGVRFKVNGWLTSRKLCGEASLEVSSRF